MSKKRERAETLLHEVVMEVDYVSCELLDQLVDNNFPPELCGEAFRLNEKIYAALLKHKDFIGMNAARESKLHARRRHLIEEADATDRSELQQFRKKVKTDAADRRAGQQLRKAQEEIAVVK